MASLDSTIDPAGIQQELLDTQAQLISSYHGFSPKKQQEIVSRGEALFSEFLAAWLVGLDPETLRPTAQEKQPDRTRLLEELQKGSKAYSVLMYVLASGNLQCACFRRLKDPHKAVALATSIATPASIIFQDLAQTFDLRYDPFSPLTSKEHV